MVGRVAEQRGRGGTFGDALATGVVGECANGAGRGYDAQSVDFICVESARTLVDTHFGGGVAVHHRVEGAVADAGLSAVVGEHPRRTGRFAVPVCQIRPFRKTTAPTDALPDEPVSDLFFICGAGGHAGAGEVVGVGKVSRVVGAGTRA